MVEIEVVQDEVPKTSINKVEDTSSMRRAAKKKQKKKNNTKRDSETITTSTNSDNNTSKSSNDRDELRKQLRSKIYEKSIGRSSKLTKDNILNKTLNEIGIDKKTFMESVDTIKKSGGFSLDSSGNIVR